MVCLTGTLTHLTALATETTHALLPPLLAHTAINGQPHHEGIIVSDSVAHKGSSLEFSGARHEANLTRRDELSVLDHELEALDRGSSVDFVSGGSNKNLHFKKVTWLLKPGEGRKKRIRAVSTIDSEIIIMLNTSSSSPPQLRSCALRNPKGKGAMLRLGQ